MSKDWASNPRRRVLVGVASAPTRGKMLRTCVKCGALPGYRCFRWTGRGVNMDPGGSYQVPLREPHRGR